MAYNNYYPQYYPSAVPVMQNNPTTPNSGITWVQGETAAKSYPVGAGQSVLLMDSEDSVMYIKTTDPSGMPLPLRIFDYTERNAPTSGISENPSSEYVSREEFDEFKEDIKKTIKGIRKPKAIEED